MRRPRPGGRQVLPELRPTARSGRGGGDAGARVYTPGTSPRRFSPRARALEGERKPVTVLFCDLVGSTALAERLGPERMHDLLSRFFELALGRGASLRGHHQPVPGRRLHGALRRAHRPRGPRPARRAGRARGCHAPCARAADPLESGEPVPLRVRMGLNTGFVVVGAIGDNLRMDYTAVGDTTHLAARLQQLAAPGAILISDATARLVEGYVALEPRARSSSAGAPSRSSCTRWSGAGARRRVLGDAGRRTLSRFVGRDRELATLDELLGQWSRDGGRWWAWSASRAWASRACSWSCGAPSAARRRVPRRALPVVRRRHAVPARAGPRARRLRHRRRRRRRSDAADKVRATLDALGVDVGTEAPYLLHLLGLKEESDDESAGRARAGGDVMARTFDDAPADGARASRRASARPRRRGPALDRRSVGGLPRLARRESRRRRASSLVATYRPGYGRPGWTDRMRPRSRSRPSAPRRQPRPSSARSSRTSVSADPLAALILDKAEGNPFFLEELAHVVGDGPRPGGPVPGHRAGRPRGAHRPAHRAGQAAPQTASVLGREFSARLLARDVVDEPAALDAAPGSSSGASSSSTRETDGEEPRLRFQARAHPGRGPRHAGRPHAAARCTARGRRGAGGALSGADGELAPVLAHHYRRGRGMGRGGQHAAGRPRRPARLRESRGARALRPGDAPRRSAPGWPGGAHPAARGARRRRHATLGDFEPARADLEAALALAEQDGDAWRRAKLLTDLGARWGGHKDYAVGSS